MANDKSNAFGIYYKDTTKPSAVFLPGLSGKMYYRASVPWVYPGSTAFSENVCLFISCLPNTLVL